MPRQARKESEIGTYHIMLRGINKQNIFEDNADRQRFINTLKVYKEKSEYELYAYCLMSNHIHLLLKEGTEPISLIIKRISSSYVYWYNQKYERCGHLFQERYKSEPVNDEGYFLTVLRYIHQNPVMAGIISDISNYKWSSYYDYIGKENIADTTDVLKMFSEEKNQAVQLFKEYSMEYNEDNFLEQKQVRITDDELHKLILGKYNLEIGTLHLLGRQQKNEILRELRKLKGVSIRQIVRITGISKSLVEKA